MSVRYTAGKLLKMEGKLFDFGEELPAEIVESFVNLPALVSAGEVVIHEVEDEVVEEVKEEKPKPKPKPKAKKKRAKNEDGTFKADDPSTPDVNEAWEQESEPKVGEDDLDI